MGDAFAIVDGTARLVRPDKASERELLLAAEACPVGAITVLRDGNPAS